MRRTVVRVLAVGIVVGAIAAGGYLWIRGGSLTTTPDTPPGIARGYVGLATFGKWRLICAASAPSAAAPAAPKPSIANQCRINQEVADAARPGQVIVATNLTMSGPEKRPTIFFRLPPTARDGDPVFVRADNANRARLVVRDCSAGECVAVGEVSAEDWDRVLAAKALQVSFPARNRQRVLVDIPVDGLADAARAMEAAQT